MTIGQKRKILRRILNTEKDIETLEHVRMKLATSEYASASMSSGSGSKSYSRADISKIAATISELKTELRNLRKLLKGESQSLGTTIYQVYNIGF